MINGAMIWLCLTDEVIICAIATAIHFGRPSIPKILEEHLIDANTESESSRTVLSFCRWD